MRALRLAAWLTILIGGWALADEADDRRDFLQTLSRGYAAGAVDSDAPNLINLLQNRFPSYLNPLADRFLAYQRNGMPIDYKGVGGALARLVVEIQSHEAERIKTAPADSLKSVLLAQRGLLEEALREQPPLCVAFVNEAEAKLYPTADIERWSMRRLLAIFTALADGRDKPVASRAATDADWAELVADAKRRGFDVASWSRMLPDQAHKSPAPAICQALLSFLDALIGTEGALGEKLLVAQVSRLLAVDPAVHRGLE